MSNLYSSSAKEMEEKKMISTAAKINRRLPMINTPGPLFPQGLYIRHKGQGKHLVFEVSLLDIGEDKDRFIAFVQRAVCFNDGGPDDAASEVLDLFKIECFDEHSRLCETLNLRRKLFALVRPHLQPVISHRFGLGFELQKILIPCFLDLFHVVFCCVIQLQDIRVVEDTSHDGLKARDPNRFPHIGNVKPHIIPESQGASSLVAGRSEE